MEATRGNQASIDLSVNLAAVATADQNVFQKIWSWIVSVFERVASLFSGERQTAATLDALLSSMDFGEVTINTESVPKSLEVVYQDTPVSAPAPTQTNTIPEATTPAPPNSSTSSGGGSAPASTQTNTIPGAAPSSPSSPSSTSAVQPFSRLVSTGSRGDDVSALQALLARDSTLYPEGLVTGYYGPATTRAIQRFQAKYGIVSSGTPSSTGYGAVGPRTLAKLNEVYAGSSLPSVPTLTTPSVASTATTLLYRSLSTGSRGDDVSVLQTLLAQDTSIYPEGLVTGYFGPATTRAIQRFQAKYGIVSSGTPQTTGYGSMGPMTTRKLKEIYR